MSSQNTISDSDNHSELPYRFAREKQIIIEKKSDIVYVKSVQSTPLQIFAEIRNFYKKPLNIQWLEREEFARELSKKYSTTYFDDYFYSGRKNPTYQSSVS